MRTLIKVIYKAKKFWHLEAQALAFLRVKLHSKIRPEQLRETNYRNGV